MNAQKRLFQRIITELLPDAVARESIRGHLWFDDQTACPTKGRPGMGDLVTLAKSDAHKAFTSPEIGDALQRLNEHNSMLSITESRIVQRLVLAY